MKKGVSKLAIILISVIVILLGILAYGVYTGVRVKAEINSLQSEKNQLVLEREDLRIELDSLRGEYNLLKDDVAKIYKTCIRENVCKGHFPLVSWYCNNAGDEADYSIASHICFCDNRCDLNATEIK